MTRVPLTGGMLVTRTATEHSWNTRRAHVACHGPRARERLDRDRQGPGERVGHGLHLTRRDLHAWGARPQPCRERVHAADDRHRRARAVVARTTLDQHVRIDARPDVSTARDVAAYAGGVVA